MAMYCLYPEELLCFGRLGMSTCVGQKLVTGSSEGLGRVVCSVKVLAGESAHCEKIISLDDCCIES